MGRKTGRARQVGAAVGLLVLLAAFMWASTAQAVTLSGTASTYANDPATGYVDAGDNNIPALGGASNDRPGIAVYRHDTLGHWWRVCSHGKVCRWVKQTDYGPVPPRVVDVNAVAARKLWGLPQGHAFPTDIGTWWLRSHGPTLTRAQLRQVRFERCNTRRCRKAFGPRKRGRR